MSNNKHTQVVDFSNPNADKITSASTQAPMTNNKQSSVEWLQAMELERDLTLADWNKAKAMHKEEIIRARLSLDRSNMSDFPKALNNSTDYYNETFGGNNEQQ